MDRFSVFVPRLLAKREGFSSGFHSCPGCGQALNTRLICKALESKGRYISRVGNVGVYTSYLPYENWQFPGSKRKKIEELSLDNDERIIAIGGDLGSIEMGMELFSKALFEKVPLIYICFPNEAGIERKPNTPFTSYAPHQPKSIYDRLSQVQDTIDRIMRIRPPFFATINPGYPFDFIEKIKRARALSCPSIFIAFSPCPTGCMYDPSMSLQAAKLAVKTGLFPLFYAVNGESKMTVNIIQRAKIEQYLRLYPEAKELSTLEFKELQREVDKRYVRFTEKLSFYR